MSTGELTIHVDDDAGSVSALLELPDDPAAFYVLAHGAGAGMRHAFMEAIATRLVARRLAVLRFQFPYMQAGKRRVDPKPRALATIAAAIETARAHAGALPIFAGGKSFGGRMTSLFAAERDPAIAGLVFLGFPLHPAGRVGRERAAHLPRVRVPMLFVQGTRDDLADFALMRQVVDELGELARLCVIDGANHGFAVPKRSGMTGPQVLDRIADEVAAFARATTSVAARP